MESSSEEIRLVWQFEIKFIFIKGFVVNMQFIHTTLRNSVVRPYRQNLFRAVPNYALSLKKQHRSKAAKKMVHSALRASKNLVIFGSLRTESRLRFFLHAT
ncbi:unnamed protein product [Enterobius vermicularis]|uniref:Ovule protein n=1 Tax=Enterobius vermicularis TaxID=51028 RepID=A0A0N4UWM5_ENTVE|nr:unnamed protein product [Enterobius vermicularis]